MVLPPRDARCGARPRQTSGGYGQEVQSASVSAVLIRTTRVAIEGRYRI
jgi:hypothetical protein